METRVFRSKINWVIAGIIVGGIVVSVWAAFSLLAEPGVGARLILVMLVGIGVLMPLWLLLGTRYLVSNDELRIVSGPFRWIIPVSDIHGLAKTFDLVSSPALSLDRLRIDYGDGKSVLISPADESAFVQLLSEHNPRLPSALPNTGR